MKKQIHFLVAGAIFIFVGSFFLSAAINEDVPTWLSFVAKEPFLFVPVVIFTIIFGSLLLSRAINDKSELIDKLRQKVEALDKVIIAKDSIIEAKDELIDAQVKQIKSLEEKVAG